MKQTFADELASLKPLSTGHYVMYGVLMVLLGVSAYYLDGARGFVFGGGPAIILFQAGVTKGISWRTPRLYALLLVVFAVVFFAGSYLGISILPPRH